MDSFNRKQAERLALERIERQYQAVHHPANVQAMAQLKALLQVEGALKIITNEPDPKGLMYTPQHPRFFVAHDVVRIEGPDHNGNVWAYSREGDYTHGHAHALLGRLTQYSREAPFSEEREELAPVAPRRVRARRVEGSALVTVDAPLSAE